MKFGRIEWRILTLLSLHTTKILFTKTRWQTAYARTCSRSIYWKRLSNVQNRYGANGDGGAYWVPVRGRCSLLSNYFDHLLLLLLCLIVAYRRSSAVLRREKKRLKTQIWSVLEIFGASVPTALRQSWPNLAWMGEPIVYSSTPNFSLIGACRSSESKNRQNTAIWTIFFSNLGAPVPPTAFADHGQIWHAKVNSRYTLPRRKKLDRYILSSLRVKNRRIFV